MSFKDIRGQEQPINILKGYIEQSRLGGGYLFVGPEGVGKKLVAKTLAKTLNCQTETLDSCDECASCIKIEKNQHPDVHFVDVEDSEVIKIEQVRLLKRDINLRPYEGRMKVFIINNAHNLTPEAENAILKILEEPPKNSLIIMISAKPALLFKTIISRCKMVKFYPLERAFLEEFLKKDYSLDGNLAHFLAYFSEGRMGRALRLKETDIVREKNKIIDGFILSHKPSFEDFPLQNKEEVRGYLNILAGWFRDIYLIKTGISHSEVINFDRKTQILKLVNRYTLFELDKIINSISDSLLYLEQNINIKLILYNLGAQLWKE